MKGAVGGEVSVVFVLDFEKWRGRRGRETQAMWPRPLRPFIHAPPCASSFPFLFPSPSSHTPPSLTFHLFMLPLGARSLTLAHTGTPASRSSSSPRSFSAPSSRRSRGCPGHPAPTSSLAPTQRRPRSASSARGGGALGEGRLQDRARCVSSLLHFLTYMPCSSRKFCASACSRTPLVYGTSSCCKP